MNIVEFEGYIDVKTAQEKYGIKPATLRRWFKKDGGRIMVGTRNKDFFCETTIKIMLDNRGMPEGMC